MFKINLIRAEDADKETKTARNRARDEQMEEIITAGEYIMCRCLMHRSCSGRKVGYTGLFRIIRK